MGITVATTRVACDTSTGTQDITTADLGDLTPKAALFIVTGATTDGTAADDAILSYGAATGTSNEWAIWITDEHNQSSSDTYGGWLNSRCVAVRNATDGTADGEAEFSAWITNGVRINWTDALGSAYLLTVVLFAGSDLSAHANNAQLGNAASNTTDVTDPGFTPDVIFTATGRFAVDRTDANAYLGLGMVHYDGVSTITQRAYSIAWRDARPTTTCGIYGTNAGGICQSLTNGALDWYGSFSDFDANGFTVTENNAGANSQYLLYLALNFNQAVGSWVGDYVTPTSTGNDSDTGPSFTPQLVFSLQSMLAAYNTLYQDGTAGSIGFSVYDADDEYANSLSSEDNVATTNTQSLSDNTAILLPFDDGTAELAASFVSFDANGFTLNYTQADGAYYFPTLAIEAESGGTTYNMSATLTAVSTTPDTVEAAVDREMAATLTAASTTTDTSVFGLAFDFAATATAASTTPDTVALAILQLFSATLTAASTTPDTVPFSVARALASTLTAASTTPDTVVLANARELAAILTAASTTPDTITLAVARELAAVLTAASTTPDTVTLAVEALLEFAATITAASTTPDTVALAVARELAAVLTAASTTPDTVPLPVARNMAATLTAASTTPDTVTLTIEGFLEFAATMTAVSTTTDTSTLAIARAMAATMTATSTTPDTVTLSIAGLIELAATITAASTTPDTVALAIARDFSATLTATSTTPDTVTLAVLRSVLASMAADSTTPDTVALAVQRVLSATLTATSTTPDTVEITQTMLFAAAILAASTTPDNVNLVVAAIEGLITVTWTAAQPEITFTSDQPSIDFDSGQPTITFTT